INNHKFRFMTNLVIFDNEFVLKQVESKDNHESFGVPQGSALSTVFANMVLDDTDKKIENILNDKESFYARFCDDVIFISSNYSKCTLAINQYCSDLREMKLPYHELEHVSF